MPVFGGSKGKEWKLSLEDLKNMFDKQLEGIKKLEYDILDVKITCWHDDYGQNLTSRVRFHVRRGRTYQFVVDGWGGDEGDIAGRLVVKKRKPFTRGRKWWQW